MSCATGGQRWARVWVVTGLLVLAGCAGTPSSPPSPAPAKPGTPAPRAAPLELERQWLQSWFEGTPVRIAMSADGSLEVAVPREFCFAPGQQAIKPALAAVLDKVAESLRRQRQVQLDLVAAPGDAAADAALSQRRAAAVRQHLRGRGVPDTRLVAATATTATTVQLRLVLQPR